MRAIIPVAGEGSRLRPHTYSLPKVLINVAGKPIIGHILDKIIEDGFDRATIIIGYMGDKIVEYVKSNYKIKCEFVEQEERLGLAHSIFVAKDTIKDEPILIILGDTIFDVDLKPVINENYSALGVKYVEDPRRFGVAELKNEFISKLIEKPENPTSNLALVGLYWIKNPNLLVKCVTDLIDKDIKTRGEYQLTDALQMMVDMGEKIKVFNVDGWYDCGKPETLLATNQHLLNKKSNGKSTNGMVVIPPVYISPRAKIMNSVIGPYTTIADDAVIMDSIIRNSIINQGAEIEKSLLDNSIIGNNAIVRGAFRRINIGDSSEIDFY
ncbi:MAG: Glucose-1-phosphate thymidylyltransferase [Ignavibacteriae bacterium]|nr:MAG: Glucose-1-phosphate thymidylyltransferase [Ignavibacteriota bacterium]